MPQISLPVELARDLAYDGQKGDELSPDHWTEAASFDVVEVVENRHTGDQRRWTSIHELVIKTADDRMWRRTYQLGLTENQDTQPFENEGDMIPFDEVKAVPVTGVKYERVK